MDAKNKTNVILKKFLFIPAARTFCLITKHWITRVTTSQNCTLCKILELVLGGVYFWILAW